jgi:hypothetical protein
MKRKTGSKARSLRAKGSPEPRDMDRAEAIAERANSVGRIPGGGGLESDDEEWMSDNPRWRGYIKDKYQELQDAQDEDEEEEDADPIDSLLSSLLILIVSPYQNIAKYGGKVKKYISVFNPHKYSLAELEEAKGRIEEKKFKDELKEIMDEFDDTRKPAEIKDTVLGYIKELEGERKSAKKKKTKKKKKKKKKKKTEKTNKGKNLI